MKEIQRIQMRIDALQEAINDTNLDAAFLHAKALKSEIKILRQEALEQLKRVARGTA